MRTGSGHRLLAAASLLLLAGTGPAGAEIYRCTNGETTVFSDVPCSESAEVHHPATRISVVDAADGLDEIARQNRSYIDQRQARLERQREQAAERRREQRVARQRRAAVAEARRTRTVVGHLGRPPFTRGPVDQRTQQQRERPARNDDRDRRRTLLSRSGGNRERILR